MTRLLVVILAVIVALGAPLDTASAASGSWKTVPEAGAGTSLHVTYNGGAGSDTLSVRLSNDTGFVPEGDVSLIAFVLDQLNLNGEYSQMVEGTLRNISEIECDGFASLASCDDVDQAFETLLLIGRELVMRARVDNPDRDASLELVAGPTLESVGLDVTMLVSAAAVQWAGAGGIIGEDAIWHIATLLYYEAGPLVAALQRGDLIAAGGELLMLITRAFQVMIFDEALLKLSDEIVAGIESRLSVFGAIADLPGRVILAGQAATYAVSLGGRLLNGAEGEPVRLEYTAFASLATPTPTASPTATAMPTPTPIATPIVDTASWVGFTDPAALDASLETVQAAVSDWRPGEFSECEGLTQHDYETGASTSVSCAVYGDYDDAGGNAWTGLVTAEAVGDGLVSVSTQLTPGPAGTAGEVSAAGAALVRELFPAAGDLAAQFAGVLGGSGDCSINQGAQAVVQNDQFALIAAGCDLSFDGSGDASTLSILISGPASVIDRNGLAVGSGLAEMYLARHADLGPAPTEGQVITPGG